MTPESPADRWCAAIASLPSVAGAMAVDTSSRQPGGGCRFLFVVPGPGTVLDDTLRAEIHLRFAASGRIPDAVYAVAGLPRRIDGSQADEAVRRLLAGEPAPRVAAEEGVSNPESLGYFAFLFDNL